MPEHVHLLMSEPERGRLLLVIQMPSHLLSLETEIYGSWGERVA